MAQVKIYGIARHLQPIKPQLSDAIHSCIVDALHFPVEKKAQRFFPMDPSDFYIPGGQGRSDRYVIIEISMFEGRTIDTKKRLLRMLFERIEAQVGISPADVEVTIVETPKHNWGFRGIPGDEIALNYRVEV